MTKLQYIKCHGSGNDFIMIDGVAQADRLSGVDLAALARTACDRSNGIGSDGVLLLVSSADGYGMRMFNPDGSEAGMCGNGIRCVARLAERYVGQSEFDLVSGGRIIRVRHAEPICRGIETYGAQIGIRTASDDFAFMAGRERFVEQPIEALADDLLFTAIDTGNPHLVARVGRIDLERLDELGRRANGMRDILPHGVNLSLCEQRDGHTLFVATYERGAGITLSCGTAMTSAATAAVLAGRMQAERDIRVMNRGGMVLCRTHIGREGIVTRLTGNATFEWSGSLDFDGEALRYDVSDKTDEQQAWQRFVDEINARS